MGKRCALSRPYAGRGSVRAATAGTVAPSHLLLKFGKLTIKFEMPFQFRKVKPHRCGTVATSHLLLKFGKLTVEFEMLCKITKSLLFQNFGRETSGAGDVLAVCGVLSAPSKKQGCQRQPCSLS